MILFDYLKLVRYKNLLIIVLTMYLMRWCVIHPFLNAINYELQFSGLNFFFLVMSTVSLAAAGYAINDYFDTKVDITNHPDSVVVGTSISRRAAMTTNNILNFLGVGLGFYASWQLGMLKIGFVFILISGGLWFYSALYKRQLLIGNLIVALFTAFVPFLVAAFEIPLLNALITPDRPPVEQTVVSVMFMYVVGYSFFAFFTTLAREIVKDIEDIEGDRMHGRRTVPVVFGVNAAKWIVTGLLLIIVGSIVYLYFEKFQDVASFIYFVFLIILPILGLISLLVKAKEHKQFRRVSMGIKGVMLAGLLYSCLLPFIIE